MNTLHAPDTGPSPAALPPYSFTNAWGLGWSRWRGSLVPLLIGTIIATVVYLPLLLPSLVNLPAQIASSRAGDAKEAAQILTAWSGLLGAFSCFALLWAVFVFLPIYAGYIWMGVQAARGTPPAVGSILQGYRRFPTVLGIVLFLVLLSLIGYLIALSVPAAVLLSRVDWDVSRWQEVQDAVRSGEIVDAGFTAAVGIAWVWVLVCWLVMVWLWARVSLCLAVAMDEEGPRAGAWKSINESWRLTTGSGWSLLGLNFTAGVFCAATLCACCAPMFVLGLPMFITLMGLAYAMMRANDLQGAQDKGVFA